ncbi:MAG: 4-hydroxy-3-methylbut-2-enyl diphosphate reductase, partial [Clostridia bacterium]
MNITLAKSSGFCFGVRRAVDIAKNLGERGIHACTLGPIIHNTNVVSELESLGIPCVDSVSDIPDRYIAIIRSHGVGADITDELNTRGIKYIDATCPYIEKIHKIVRENAARGRCIIVIGTKTHPEVRGIAGQCKNALVIEHESDIELAFKANPDLHDLPITIVAQTTIGRAFWNKCIEILKKECTKCEIFDTICLATSKRQDDAQMLAKSSDAMIVIGDRTSSNTKGLVRICKSHCEHVFHIENADELPTAALRDFSAIGITAGASTPDWIIKEVKNKMSEQVTNNEETVIAEGESFADMLEASLKTLNTGEKV